MPFWPTCPFELTLGALFSPGSLLFPAYLDPGMGSYLFQIVLASLFGGMFALKQFWFEIKNWMIHRSGIRSSRMDPLMDHRRVGIRPLHIKRPRIDAQSSAEFP